MIIYPNLLIHFNWDFITLYFPLKPLGCFCHCGKAQRSSSCILGGLTLTRLIRATSATFQDATLFYLTAIEEVEAIVELLDAELIEGIKYKKSEIRDRRSEGGDRKTEVRGRSQGIRVQRAEVVVRKS